jgi:urea transport system ATP-binding protein
MNSAIAPELTPSPTQLMLQVSGLNVYYGESHILRDVDLSVPAGQMVCLIGRNGVGKTTLLKTIMGLLKPRTGTITFAGELITGQSPDRRARLGIGYVPQGREIIPRLTVKETCYWVWRHVAVGERAMRKFQRKSLRCFPS